MSYPLIITILCLFTTNAFSMGDPSRLPSNPAVNPAVGEGVGTINKLNRNPNVPGTYIDQQDQQEKNYQDIKLREQQEWDKNDHDIDRYRYDEP